MKVVRFNKNKHFQAMVECLVFRDAHVPERDRLPKIGYIAVEKGKLIAVSFLRKVEGGYAQFDGLATNPTATPEERHQGIDLVAVATLKKAKTLGITLVHAHSRDYGTIMRSEKHGFVKLPHTYLVVDLTDRGL